MIIEFKDWKSAIINNGHCTYSPFTENAAKNRYHVTSYSLEFDVDYENLDTVLNNIYVDSLFPLFNGSLEHAENVAQIDKLFVHYTLEDSLMTIDYIYAFNDEDEAYVFAESIGEEVWDTDDEDSLYFLTD